MYNERMYEGTDVEARTGWFAPDPDWEQAQQLEARLVELEREISTRRSEQAEIAARLDRFQIDLADGYPRMGDWLAHTLDLSWHTADRIWLLARTDPDIRARLATGDWGLDRAAALTRLRNAGATPEQLRQAENLSLGKINALHDRIRPTETLTPEQAAASRFFVAQPDLEASALKFWGMLPAADGETVLHALERKESQFPNLPGQNQAQRRADALVAICTDSLTGDHSDHQDREAVTVGEIFIDAAVASETEGMAGAVTRRGLKAGPDLLEELLCGGRIRAVAVDGLRPVAVTDSTGPIPPAIRAFVWWRDGGQCSISGCRSRYRLQIHHLTPRHRGGTHDPQHLALFCWYHHHIAIHLLGMHLDPASPPGRRTLLSHRPRPPPDHTLPTPVPISALLQPT
jgi:hypothetical protein